MAPVGSIGKTGGGGLHAPGLVHGQSSLELQIFGGLDPHVQAKTIGHQGVTASVPLGSTDKTAAGRIELHRGPCAKDGVCLVIIHPCTEITVEFNPGCQIPGLGFFLQHLIHVVDFITVLGDCFILLRKLGLQGIKLTREFVDF